MFFLVISGPHVAVGAARLRWCRLHTGGATGGQKNCFMLLIPVALPTLSAAAEPLSFYGLPLLFADESGIQSRSGLVRTTHPARTRPAPVLEATQPWENGRIYIYGSVYRDEASGELRMWYMSRPSTGRVVGTTRSAKGQVPGLRNDGADLVLYATSRDGIRWHRPELRLYPFAGSLANNIVFDLHSPSVLLDLRDSDPGKRYKMLGCWRGYRAAYSSDGLNWNSYPKSAVLEHSDTITLAQNPATGEYLAYHKCPATVRGYPRRVVWLSRSTDFQTWTAPELVFAPDEADDEWATEPRQRTEVYDMSVFAHAGGYIGLPAMFRVMAERPRSELQPEQSPHDGPVDIQLASSTDGKVWRRPWPRNPIIPRGNPGTFDGGAILGVSSTAVNTETETWVYYTAITTGHGAPIPPKRCSIGRAEWRLHGFVSLDAGPEGGRLETLPVQFSKSELYVNVDAPRGELRVQLLESDGRPIVGFSLADCLSLSADDTHARVRWNGGAQLPTDRPVRVAIEMRNARLYSLSEDAPK